MYCRAATRAVSRPNLAVCCRGGTRARPRRPRRCASSVASDGAATRAWPPLQTRARSGRRSAWCAASCHPFPAGTRPPRSCAPASRRLAALHLLHEEAKHRHLPLGRGQVDRRALIVVADVRADTSRQKLLPKALHVAARRRDAQHDGVALGAMARARLRASRPEVVGDRALLASHRVIQRRAAPPVDRAEVGAVRKPLCRPAAFDQELHRIEEALGGSEVQRRSAVVVALVHANCAELEDLPEAIDVATRGGSTHLRALLVDRERLVARARFARRRVRRRGQLRSHRRHLQLAVQCDRVHGGTSPPASREQTRKSAV
eukprot:scaffold35952_cov44-Phaeocystis_antarctica.AAC.4